MIHEAIAALLGYGGNFFADDVRTQPLVLDFHPGEIQLLNRVHSLGLKYKTLKDFVNKNVYQPNWSEVSGKESSGGEAEVHANTMYMHAFSNGLSHLLQPYVNDVATLEDKALRDPCFTISDLLSSVHKYDAVFSIIINMINEVTQKKIRGIYLLTYFYRKLNTCIGEERASVECLLHYCHKVLLKLLTSWLLYGCIMGTHDEFFIQRKQKDVAESSESVTGDLVAASTVTLGPPGSTHSTTASTVQFGAPGSTHPSDTISVNTATAGAVKHAETLPASSGVPSSEKPEGQTAAVKSEDDIFQYEICPEKLPSYILPSLAYKILFIGETIMMFGGNAKKDDKVGRNDKNRNWDAFSAFVEFTDLNAGSCHAVWGDKELKFLSRLHELQNARSLSMASFEEIVDDIRTCLAEHLWQLAVDKAELFTQFKLIKDFFLLGRGELFLEFIHLANNILQKTPTNKSEREVNSAFQIAARKVLLNDESAMDKFKFHLPVPGTSASNEDSVMGWNVVGLTYKVIWPLHFIFTKAVLSNYNQLFRFLLRVKKVQMEIHAMWIKHLQSRTRCKPDVWQLHRNLMFLVDNLQYYMQVDVLESQYTQLQTKINETKDFEVVKTTHTQFQINILSQSFLLMEQRGAGAAATGRSLGDNSVHKCLCLFLELCEEFCSNVDQWSVDGDWDQLDGMVERCNWLIQLLLQMLVQLHVHPCGTYLSQLLLRLNYNHWFQRKVMLSTSIADSSLGSSFTDSAL